MTVRLQETDDVTLEQMPVLWKKDQMNTSIQKKEGGYQLIRFFLIWAIVGHHILTTASENNIPVPFLINRVSYRISAGIGHVAVSMFFMLSGALLWRNHKTIESYKKYFFNQVVKILVPLWICTVPLILVDYVKNPGIVLSEYARSTIGYNLLGVDLYVRIFKGFYPYHVCGEWFTSVILTMYLLYPLLRKASVGKRTRILTAVLITGFFLINLRYGIMTAGNGWYSFTRGLFFFYAGILFEQYKGRIDSNRCAGVAFICFCIIFLFFNRTMFGSVFLPNTAAALCSFVVLFRLNGLLRPVFAKPFFFRMIDGTCRYSYLIYLTHHYLILLFMPLLLDQEANTVRFCIFIVFISALIYGFVKMISPPVRFALGKLSGMV